MDTYFEYMPLELNIEILNKCPDIDVGNLFTALSDMVASSELGKQLSFKELGVIPKEIYQWEDLFNVYHKVRKLGFNRYNIKHPIINQEYDDKLRACVIHESSDISTAPPRVRQLCTTLDRSKLTLANSYGVIPSTLLRFLYRENVYDRYPDLMIYILNPLCNIHDYQSVEDILDILIQKYGNLTSLPQMSKDNLKEYLRVFDKLLDNILNDKEMNVDDKIRIIKKFKTLYGPTLGYRDSLLDYFDNLSGVTNENVKVIKTLLEIYPHFIENELLKYLPKIAIDVIKRLDIDISFNNMMYFAHKEAIEYIISSGKYERELSDQNTRQMLLINIKDRITQHVSLDYFLEMVEWINKIMKR